MKKSNIESKNKISSENTSENSLNDTPDLKQSENKIDQKQSENKADDAEYFPDFLDSSDMICQDAC